MMKLRSLNFDSRRRRNKGVETTPTPTPTTEWEMRPGGMLVQKRSEISRTPDLRIRVSYGVVRYQISANSHSTFGELKKLLTAETGLQADEQRLIYRGKERENGEYLDRCGLKDRSRVVLIDDPESKERRTVEMRRNGKIQAVRRLIDGVSMEVDRLEEQVGVIEKAIANGNKVAELQITTLIEMLMRQAVRLDCISPNGDACAIKTKDLQGHRVQKCVETLDVLKVSNSKHRVQSVVSSTKWETFDFDLEFDQHNIIGNTSLIDQQVDPFMYLNKDYHL